MLTTYDRLMRLYRLEATLAATVVDRRDQAEVLTWTRDRSKRATVKTALVLFSLLFLASCATQQPWYDRAETVKAKQDYMLGEK
jgi:hypothetical protein